MTAKKKFEMPSAFTIVFIALIITAILTYFVPVSVYSKQDKIVTFNAMYNDDGNIIQNVGPQPKGIWDVLVAPIQGFQSASGVGIALFIAGGFLAVLSASGALEAGIGRLLSRFKGNVLIAVMMFVFAILGTVFGLWEEIPAFAIVIIPLFVLAGYDVMTGLAVLFVGATIGNMASLVNPFSTGAAVSIIGNPELSLGSGILLRAVLFVVLDVIGTIMVIRYANKVKANPSKSVLAGLTDVKTLTEQGNELPEMNSKRKKSLIVFVLVVLFLLIGYTPWAAIGGEGISNIINAPLTLLAKVPVLGSILGAAHVTPFGDWGFDEFSFLFLTGSFILLIINRMNEKEFLKIFLGGAKDMISVVLVLGIARGISIIMGSSTQGMSVTFIYWISNALATVPLWIFAVFAVLAYVGIGLFLQSTSGVAGISMPILGAVAAALFVASSVGSTGGQIILISAFTVGINFMSGVYPGATTMGTLELVNVPYNEYLRYMLKTLVPLLIIAAIIISIAPYIGLAR